jgi:hypothetical protein
MLKESLAGLGLAVHLMHEIESYFAQATLLGLTSKQRTKHHTVDEMWAARDRMTFGQLVLLFKEDWRLDPDFERQLDWFVNERNTIIHRITAMDEFDVNTAEGRQMLDRRLATFISAAYPMLRIFRGACIVSNDFSSFWLKEQKGIDIKHEVPDEWANDGELFLSVATYKHEA